MPLNPVNYATIGVLSWLGVNGISSASNIYGSYNGIPKKPVKPVSVVLPSLTIDEYLIPFVMDNLLKNNVIEAYPDMFEFILVTDPDFKNVDCYYHYFDKIIKAPYGKLTARDMAIKQASGDIIVAIDTDRYYPKNWLNELLKPFNRNEVVATTSYPVYSMVYELMSNMFKHMYYAGKMDGGGSAFLKDAYYAVGGFDLNIDQFDWEEMIEEEEFNFMRKLQSIGEVVYVPYPSFAIARISAPYRLKYYKNNYGY
jgi:cellulose synthase/poly-beta-1,6-N-acetylglucosamine synthase-like glycosyltransferase